MNPTSVPNRVKAARPAGRVVSMGPPRGVSDDDCGTAEMLIEPAAVNPLPGYGGRNQYAYFKPTAEELALLNAGGFLELNQIGQVVQPFSLTVWPPDIEVAPAPAADNVTQLPCPTCSGEIRETVGMVCQTCGADYGSVAACVLYDVLLPLCDELPGEPPALIAWHPEPLAKRIAEGLRRNRWDIVERAGGEKS